jgi:serine/threonine protein kinase
MERTLQTDVSGMTFQSPQQSLQNPHSIHFSDILHSKIGHGAFGEVAKAYDVIDKKNVAIKITGGRKRDQDEAKYEMKVLHYIQTKDTERLFFFTPIHASYFSFFY